MRKAQEANSYLDDAAFKAALADPAEPEAVAPQSPPAKVVGARFGGLQPRRVAVPNSQPKGKSALTQEMLNNLDQAIGFNPARLFGKKV